MNNTIKKVVTILSFTVILFSIISFANSANVLTETDAANKLSSLGIIVDQSSNTEAYNLDISITRREMLKVMINLSLIKVGDTCTGKFADLQESDWGCKYAETALARGFIAPNSLFRPNDNISKVEALKMILQARDISKNNSLEDWRAGYVDAALINGILSNSFTDYNTVGVRGWIFLAGANAVNATPDYKVSCVDELEGTPVITSISTNSGTVDTKIVIKGCNLSGFEGDKNVWIENNQGIKGIIYSETGSTSNLLNITLKSQLCQSDTSYSGLACDSWLTLVPGDYKIYVNPWGKQSNIIDFTVNNSDKIGLTESQARVIAEQNCIGSGETLGTGSSYNSNSKTWWFDANLNPIKEGCYPACVVSENTKTTEINWRCTGLIVPEMSYQDVMDYVNQNITEIMTSYSSIVPANGKWFVDGFGFTSYNYVYVDYEDGHNLYRALLNCNKTNNTISCDPFAVFEIQTGAWVVVQGEDTQKDNSIVYQYAVDGEWKR
ncbi:MAG: S-layer homology domain-containing protein [Candidatus Gracilibacteria bacterium]